MIEQSYKEQLMDELNLESQIERIKKKASMNRVANVSYPKAPAPKVEEIINETAKALTLLGNTYYKDTAINSQSKVVRDIIENHLPKAI